VTLFPPSSPFSLSFYDCAEKVVLRFLQLALLDPSPLLPLHTLSLVRALELGASPGVLEYFHLHHRASSNAHYSTETGKAARSTWAALLGRREGISYRQAGGYEILPTSLNFLAALQALFPRLKKHTVANREAFDSTAAFFSAPSPTSPSTLTSTSLTLSWEDVTIAPPITTLRFEREARDKWTPVTSFHPVAHSRATDQRSHATLCIGGVACFYLHWFLREFLAEPQRGLSTLFSGHSQMYVCTPHNSGTHGQRSRDQDTDMLD
jgi:hypothetical protein